MASLLIDKSVSGVITYNSQEIKGLADPTTSGSASTRNYVDSIPASNPSLLGLSVTTTSTSVASLASGSLTLTLSLAGTEFRSGRRNAHFNVTLALPSLFYVYQVLLNTGFAYTTKPWYYNNNLTDTWIKNTAGTTQLQYFTIVEFMNNLPITAEIIFSFTNNSLVTDSVAGTLTLYGAA